MPDKQLRETMTTTKTLEAELREHEESKRQLRKYERKLEKADAKLERKKAKKKQKKAYYKRCDERHAAYMRKHKAKRMVFDWLMPERCDNCRYYQERVGEMRMTGYCQFQPNTHLKSCSDFCTNFHRRTPTDEDIKQALAVMDRRDKVIKGFWDKQKETEKASKKAKRKQKRRK